MTTKYRIETFVIVSFTLIYSYAFATELTPLEKKIAEIAKRNTTQAISFLEKTVNINSGTMNHEGVTKVGELFKKEFDAIGFRTTWIPLKHVNRAGHLFAEHRGDRGKRLLLIGHLDTVFEKDSAFQPFKKTGTRATGQGVNDMKGGNVIALYALKALHEAGALQNTSIIVAFTGDEEMPGEPVSVARKDLVDAAKRSDIALGFESAEGMNTGTIARRGIGGWLLQVKGIQSHSSVIYTKQVGFGAIYEAGRILNAFQSELSNEQFLTINPGVIVGGTEVKYDREGSRGTAFGKTNVVAKSATVEGDLRFISEEQKQKAQERMREIVKRNLTETSAEISFTEGYPGMAPTEGNKKLLKFFDQVSRDLKLPAIQPFDPGGRGAADISFVASYVDCLDGLGAMGNGGHTPDEDIDLDLVPALIQRAAILIYRLTNTNGY